MKTTVQRKSTKGLGEVKAERKRSLGIMEMYLMVILQMSELSSQKVKIHRR